jgi:hypothetical protein
MMDSLFWPIMPTPTIAAKLDSNRQPLVIQHYTVPPPRNDSFQQHDEAVFSMWMHFVDFCTACIETSRTARIVDCSPCFLAPDVMMNMYTRKQRLSVFRMLSSGHSPLAEAIHAGISRQTLANQTTSMNHMSLFISNKMSMTSPTAITHTYSVDSWESTTSGNSRRSSFELETIPEEQQQLGCLPGTTIWASSILPAM